MSRLQGKIAVITGGGSRIGLATARRFVEGLHHRPTVNRPTEEASMQTLQTDYFAAYRNLKLSRDAKGVLVAEFHSDGGPFIMNAQAHTEFVDAFHRIGQDRANKIVIMTGAGGQFIGDVDWSSFGDVTDPDVWSQ